VFRRLAGCFPRSDGEPALIALLAAVAAHLAIAAFGPDARGFLFHCGVVVEAIGQSALLVLPPLAAFLGIRAVAANPEDWPGGLAFLGGSSLSLLTLLGLLCAVF
jgi:hypothetical protein